MGTLPVRFCGIGILPMRTHVMGTATMCANLFPLGSGYSRTWSRIILTCRGLSVVPGLVFILLVSWGHIGAALTLATTESLVLSYAAYRGRAQTASGPLIIHGFGGPGF